MKQITIISGKGGTGKTSVTAAFASIAKDSVFADCDVDAADLHLILKPKIKKTMNFSGLKIASIKKDLCIKCKKCYNNCKFDAIDEDINIITSSCEGCGVCRLVCPENAIDMIDRNSGFAYISETRFGPMSHAVLNTAEEASGKLVTLVRENAKKLAEEKEKNLIIIDGPPGIGCPVISAISGVNLVVIVTEPTLSAIHDLKRIQGVAKHFNIPSVVIINKFTINEKNTEEIKKYCADNNIFIAGLIPYDKIVTEAMINEKTINEYQDNDFSKNIKNIWMKIYEVLKNQ